MGVFCLVIVFWKATLTLTVLLNSENKNLISCVRSPAFLPAFCRLLSVCENEILSSLLFHLKKTQYFFDSDRSVSSLECSRKRDMRHLFKVEHCGAVQSKYAN